MPRHRPRQGTFGALLTAFLLAARTAGGTPLGSATDSKVELGRIEVEIALVGRTTQTPLLSQAIAALAQSEGLTPHFVYFAELPRSEIVEAAMAAVEGHIRVWIELLQPNQALLLLSGPTGQSYIVRELPVSHTLNEVDREQIAQVVQSSTQALLHGDRGLDRPSMQRALGVDSPPPPPPVPPQDGFREDPAADFLRNGTAVPARPTLSVSPVPPRTPTAAAHAVPLESAPSSLGQWTLGPSYSVGWTGTQLKERHSLGLRAGLTEIADGPWSLAMAAYTSLPQRYRTSLIGLRRQAHINLPAQKQVSVGIGPNVSSAGDWTSHRRWQY